MPPLKSRDILTPWRTDSFCNAATSAAVHKLLRIAVPLPLGVSSDMLTRRGDRPPDMEISRGRNEQQPVHLPEVRCRTVRTGSFSEAFRCRSPSAASIALPSRPALVTYDTESAIVAQQSATATTTILPHELPLTLHFPVIHLKPSSFSLRWRHVRVTGASLFLSWSLGTHSKNRSGQRQRPPRWRQRL